MTDFVLTPAMFARIQESGADSKEWAKRIKGFASAFGVDADVVRDAYLAQEAEIEADTERKNLLREIPNFEVSLGIATKLRKALGLGMTVGVVYDDKAERIRLIPQMPGASDTGTGSTGRRNQRWTYFLDGRPLRVKDGDNSHGFTSIKAALKYLADTGDAEAARVLEIEDNPHKYDPKRWGTETKLNSWMALQESVILKARFTRTR